MIGVTVTLSQEGVVADLVAEGHAGFALRGTDIVCSAFTVLLRTFARTVEASPGVTWSVPADAPGRFRLAVTGVAPETAAEYRGWCSFLLRGLEDLTGDEPGRVQIAYETDGGRLFHGS